MRNSSLLPSMFTHAEAYALGTAQLRSRNRILIKESQCLWSSLSALASSTDERARFENRARALLRLIPGACLAHESAAFLHGFPLPRGPNQLMHIARARAANLSARPGVRTWRTDLPEADICIHAPSRIPLTSMRQTLLMLAQTWAPEDLVAAIDWMVREPRPMVENRWEPHDTLPGISAWLESKKRRRGAPALRQALALARVGSDSPMETKLRLILDEHGLPEPECNPRISVLGPGGAPILVQPDLAYPIWKMAVEYQGAGHATAEVMRRDITKKARLEQAGWMVVQIHADHMRRSGADAVVLVREALQQRGWKCPELPPVCV